jgi:hypothetical protein
VTVGRDVASTWESSVIEGGKFNLLACVLHGDQAVFV